MAVVEGTPVYEVAVVGAHGFLGAAVMRAALAAGIKAIGFTMEEPLIAEGVLDERARDVSSVIWCASRINPRVLVDHPELAAADSADLARALDAYGHLAKPPRFVNFSSGGTVYGPPETPPFHERQSVHPVNDYGRAKRDLELQLAASAPDSVTLRVANAYGPGQRPAPGQGVLAHWFEAVLAGEPLHLFGNPQDTRDYVYVGDIARAALAAHAAASPPQIVNVGSGLPTTLDELLDVFVTVVAPHQPEVIRHPPRSTDTAHSTLDVSLASEALAWTPQVTLEQGVSAQWEWRRAQ